MFFSTTFICNISHSKKNSAKYMCIGLRSEVHDILRQTLMKLALSQQIFERYSDIVGVVGIATGYRLDCPRIEFRRGQDFPHLSKPALGHTQPPVQWVTGYFPGVKRPGRGFDHPPHLAPRLKKE